MSAAETFEARLPGREYYIDHLRATLTAMVVFFHSAITYGGFGSWFYREAPVSARPSSLILQLFSVTLQAFFMGFFFLLAGYFTPTSLARKGYLRFLADRFLRLGAPLLVFLLVLGPLAVGLSSVARGHGFWIAIISLWKSRAYVNGPLWFAQALLCFDLVYCVWHFVQSRRLQKRTKSIIPLPGRAAWWLSMFLTGVAALMIRQVFPPGTRFAGVWPADFAIYIVLFAVGIKAGRSGWLGQLTWRQARPFVVAALVAWPVMPIALMIFSAHGGGTPRGLAWPSVLLAFWEPCIAWGVIAAMLVMFRARINRPSAAWNWLSRRAYGAYILHSPVLVGTSLLLQPWHGAPLVKFAVAGSIACAAAWLAADPLVRLPGVRRIV